MVQRYGEGPPDEGLAMNTVQLSIEVSASPAEVWKVVGDPRNLPLWDRHIVGVDGVRDEGLREGSEYTTHVRFMGARAHATSKVLELQPPRYAKIKVHGIVDAMVETWVEPQGKGRTLLHHRVEYRFPGGPLGELAAGAVKVLGIGMLLRRGVEAQKRQVEATAR